MSGFFELVDAVWAEADTDRNTLKRQHGADLGNWLADIHQYGSAWQGDVWEWTAVGVENHPAFMTIPESHPWDHPSYGWTIRCSTDGPSEVVEGNPITFGGWQKPHKRHHYQGKWMPMGVLQRHANGAETVVGVQL